MCENEEDRDDGIPFMAILGDNPELRIIQFLMAAPSLQFNDIDIMNATSITTEQFNAAIYKLHFWGVVDAGICEHEIVFGMGRDNKYYNAFCAINNEIIAILLSNTDLKEN